MQILSEVEDKRHQASSDENRKSGTAFSIVPGAAAAGTTIIIQNVQDLCTKRVT
jgi:hypothetical protein